MGCVLRHRTKVKGDVVRVAYPEPGVVYCVVKDRYSCLSGASYLLGILDF